jgi:hypothetical protein
MTAIATPPVQSITPADLASVAFCEACERLVAVRALLEDPRHQTRRQGAALTEVLRTGVGAVARQLQAVTAAAFDGDENEARLALAGIGTAFGALRRIHEHLGYLSTRWPLGTADLFTRKLVAEGIPIPIPTLLVSGAYDDLAEEVGEVLRQQCRDIGIPMQRPSGGAPLIAIPMMDLLDPLCWPALLYPLADTMVKGLGLADGLRSSGQRPGDHDGYRRACSACVAARLLGEPTFLACAVRSLLVRLSGSERGADLSLLARYSAPYSQPYEAAPIAANLGAYFAGLLAVQQAGRYGWGQTHVRHDDLLDLPETFPEIAELVGTRLPLPAQPDEALLSTLCTLLEDGRPINAAPPRLPHDFARSLANGADADRFYAVVAQVGEQPSSLAAILEAGWRYKLRRSYPLCRELLGGADRWDTGFDNFAGHVLERSALLAQSMEAAYVQQVFARWRDR